MLYQEPNLEIFTMRLPNLENFKDYCIISLINSCQNKIKSIYIALKF